MKASLRALPRSVAHQVAQRGAPKLTALTREAFDGNRNVYGDARPAGVDGQPLTLVKSGATRAALKFTANGTIIRAVLGTRYAKYLIGKYGILPNGALPVKWSRALAEIVKEAKPPA
jgi:hypothetical protein